jgi:hypothetical protein
MARDALEDAHPLTPTQLMPPAWQGPPPRPE